MVPLVCEKDYLCLRNVQILAMLRVMYAVSSSEQIVNGLVLCEWHIIQTHIYIYNMKGSEVGNKQWKWYKFTVNMVQSTQRNMVCNHVMRTFRLHIVLDCCHCADKCNGCDVMEEAPGLHCMCV